MFSIVRCLVSVSLFVVMGLAAVVRNLYVGPGTLGAGLDTMDVEEITCLPS